VKKFFFLPSEIFFGLFFIWVLVLWKMSFGYQLLASIIVFVILFSARRAGIPFRDTAKGDGELFLSPVHGEIRSIRKDISLRELPEYAHEIRISISGWSEKGLYLPTSGEVKFLKAFKGRRIPRDSDSRSFYGTLDDVAHTDFILGSGVKTKTLMRFVDCRYSVRPTMWLKSGDRGRGAACFGYYPFGGTLLIYLPNNSDILVFENEKIVPGQSVIAVINDSLRN
jgi:hypothetical protein